jgi:hypothetical protein
MISFTEEQPFCTEEKKEEPWSIQCIDSGQHDIIGGGTWKRQCKDRGQYWKEERKT